MKQNQGIISSDTCRPKSPSKRTSPTHVVHEPAPSVMNAVEYCLLHGLKLAGPEHPAILCAQESLSYGALAARVSQFTAGLRETGVRPSDRVGMLMLDTPDLITLHLGAIAAGAIAVAISSRASAAELAQILAIVRPAALVVDAEFAGVAAGAVAASSPNTRLIRRDDELAAWKAIPATTLAPVRRRLGDPAFWVMTRQSRTVAEYAQSQSMRMKPGRWQSCDRSCCRRKTPEKIGHERGYALSTQVL